MVHHEIVRAQNKVSKGHPKTHPTSCSVVTCPQVQCEVICGMAWPSTKCYFNEFYSCGSSRMIKNRINQRLWAFGLPWSSGFVLGQHLRSGFWKQSKWPWNMIHSMPCRNPCRLYIHLAFTYSIGPSNVVWSSELGRAPSFPPMRVLRVGWSRALSLVWEVALSPCVGRDRFCVVALM